MQKEKTCFLFGNCQIKVIAQYLSSHKPFTDIYKTIKYFYIEDNVETLDSHKSYLLNLDLFIFQHCSKDALKTDEESYTPSYIASHMIPSHCVIITLPSIYMNIDFLDPLGSTINNDRFPRYSFNQSVYDMILRQEPIASIASYFKKVHYSDYDIEKHIAHAFESIRRKEAENNTSIRISEFFRKNYLKRRLMHTVNHPNKYVFIFLMNEIYKSLGLEQDDTILSQPDKMVKYGHLPLMRCVQSYYKKHMRAGDDEYVFDYKGQFFLDAEEYLQHLYGWYREQINK